MLVCALILLAGMVVLTTCLHYRKQSSALGNVWGVSPNGDTGRFLLKFCVATAIVLTFQEMGG